MDLYFLHISCLCLTNDDFVNSLVNGVVLFDRLTDTGILF